MILLLTYSWHFHSGPLSARLTARGLPWARIDLDDWDGRVSVALAPGGGTVTVDGKQIYLCDVRGVFTPKGIAVPPTDPDDALSRWVAAERTAAARGLWSRLGHARHLYMGIGVEPDKLAQADAAVAAGLRVPATLYTDDPEAVRAFAAQHAAVVAKLHEALTQSMDGSGPRVSTRLLTADDLAAIDEVAGCPMIFQEWVPKASEIRAAVVGDRVFAARIVFEGVEADTVADWRVGTGPARWEAAALPGDVAAALVATHRALGLHFGAVDLIVRPDGEHVFLETNAHGEWWMLQDAAGQDVLGAMVDFLSGEGA